MPCRPCCVCVLGLVDPDVMAEQARVNAVISSHALNPKNNAIFIHNLKKIYYGRGTVPTKVAVKSVSLTIPHGEIFGLLGANGAGKVTIGCRMCQSCVYPCVLVFMYVISHATAQCASCRQLF